MSTPHRHDGYHQIREVQIVFIIDPLIHQGVDFKVMIVDQLKKLLESDIDGLSGEAIKVLNDEYCAGSETSRP